ASLPLPLPEPNFLESISHYAGFYYSKNNEIPGIYEQMDESALLTIAYNFLKRFAESAGNDFIETTKITGRRSE
ncbi:1760_t:CDS:2, partial [Entrophospora sp. SA101]